MAATGTAVIRVEVDEESLAEAKVKIASLDDRPSAGVRAGIGLAVALLLAEAGATTVALVDEMVTDGFGPRAALLGGLIGLMLGAARYFDREASR